MSFLNLHLVAKLKPYPAHFACHRQNGNFNSEPNDRKFEVYDVIGWELIINIGYQHLEWRKNVLYIPSN